MCRKKIMLVFGLILSASLVFSGGQKATGKNENKSLSILMFSSFVKENDETLKNIAMEFGAKKGIPVTVDFVGIAEMYPKLTAEAASKSGHDIIGLENLQVAMYENQLLSITDTIESIIAKKGPFAAAAITATKKGTDWKALPWWIVPFNVTYRSDYFKAANQKAPTTWDELLTSGSILKSAGHPVGFSFGSCGDANNSLNQLLWAFGAGLADKNGVITVNSSEMRNALAFAQKLAAQAMPQDVASWADNSANNNFMLSGIGSWTFNAISIWISALRNTPDIANNFDFTGALQGPAGAFGSGDFYSLAIWDFSKNSDIAKEFLAYLYDDQQMNRYIDSGKGFNLPTHPAFYNHPVFNDPKLAPLRKYADTYQLAGYPAPPDARAQAVYQRWLVPNMFLKVISGKSTITQAINEAEAELVEIGYKKK